MRCSRILLSLLLWLLQFVAAEEVLGRGSADPAAVAAVESKNVAELAQKLKLEAAEFIQKTITDAREIKEESFLNIVKDFEKTYGQLGEMEKTKGAPNQPGVEDKDTIQTQGSKADIIFDLYMTAQSFSNIYYNLYDLYPSPQERNLFYRLMISISKATCLCAFNNNPALLALAL